VAAPKGEGTRISIEEKKKTLTLKFLRGYTKSINFLKIFKHKN
jgi:hypothetical protein